MNNSTEHARLQFTRDFAQNFDNVRYTWGVFIDFSKAFDAGDHQILLKKLKRYGVNVKHWLASEAIFSKEKRYWKH